MNRAVRVTVWNEFLDERSHDVVRRIYPEGIHRALADGLSRHEGLDVVTATLDEPEQGLPESLLERTDVLVWWGHRAHAEVRDEVVQRVHRHVLAGMGFIALHSTHYARIFRLLMGTTCSLTWRVAGERERLWNLAPAHPITEGIGACIDLAQEEMYGERFDIPEPDELVFISWFPGGEVFRSGCCWTRGNGKIFYFRPGHEIYPTYHHPEVIRVIANAARWACPVLPRELPGNRHQDPIPFRPDAGL